MDDRPINNLRWGGYHGWIKWSQGEEKISPVFYGLAS